MIEQKKSILLIHKHFYPDSPPYAIMLKDIQELLIKNRYDVDVLSSQPSYKSIDIDKKQRYVTKLKENSKIIRLPNLNIFNHKYNQIINIFFFPILVFIYLLFCKKYNVISVGAVPPVILAFAVALATKIRGNKLIYHCGDIHPESGKLMGNFKFKSVYSILEFMDNFTCTVASKIILLSEDMKKSIISRKKVFSKKIAIINNFDLNVQESIKFEDSQVKNRVLFTGNLGRAQNLESFILALKNNQPLFNFELCFVGEGSALKKLKKLAIGVDCIKFIPHQPIEVVRKMMSNSSMGIISLQKDIIKYAYPSKTMTYLSEGLPVLVSVGIESELSKFVQLEKVGIALECSNQNQIYDVFKKISNGSLSYDRNQIKKVFEKHFSKTQFNKKYLKIFSEIGS